MSCALCGGRICRKSKRLDSCHDCGANFIAFDLNLSTGSLDKEWAAEATQYLEAKIGRMIFQSVFESEHELEGLDNETLFIIRIRALRQYIRRIS